MEKTLIGLVGIAVILTLGMASDGYASTWTKEIPKGYAQDKAIDTLKGATDRVQELSENYACSDPSSWSCLQTQDLGEKTNAAWAILAIGVGVLLPMKVAMWILR